MREKDLDRAFGNTPPAFTGRINQTLAQLEDKPRRIPRLRAALEWFSLATGTAVAATLAFYSVRLVLQSHEFEDISQGVDATPLWIPQLSMAFGSVVLLIALIDDLVMTTLGRAPARLATHSGEAARME